ncbi:MAG: hypothetical protein PHH01_03165 [Patescibacteria group bacterium]|nr:hypothetical protein [Patescibacteria group bacterium]
MRPYRYDLPRYQSIRKGEWILIRSERHSIIRQDLVKQGVESLPRVLWEGTKKGEYKENAQGYWYKNCPSPEDIKKRVLNNKKWFTAKTLERKKYFFELRSYLRKLLPKIKSGKLTSKQCLDELITAKAWMTKTRPYANMSQLIIDRVIDEYFNKLSAIVTLKTLILYFLSLFLTRVSRSRSQYYRNMAPAIPSIMIYSYFKDALKEDYEDKITKAGIISIRRIHDFKFPPPPLIEEIKELNFDKKRIGLPIEISEILKKKKRRTNGVIRRYSEILPQLINMSEETSYTYRTYMICVNHLLEKIAIFLVVNYQIKNIPEILNYSLQQIIKKFDEIEKTPPFLFQKTKSLK